MNGNTISSRIQSRAWLRVFGPHLDLDGISLGLGVQASDTHRAGDRDRLGQPLPRDLWSLGSPIPRNEPLDTHIRWLSRTLESHYDFLRSLKANAQVRSFCGIIAEGDECSFRLSPQALRLFVDLAIDLELSLIFLGGNSSVPAQPDDETSSPETEPDGYETNSHVRFTLHKQGLDLHLVSGALGITPSEADDTGKGGPSGRPPTADVWSLAVPVDPIEGLDSHLNWLAQFLADHTNFIRSLGAEIEVHCDFGTASDTGGVGVSPEMLRPPVELGAAFAFKVQLL